MGTLEEQKAALANAAGVGSAPPPVVPLPEAAKHSSVAGMPAVRVTEATRVPLSIPKQALEVPDLPGYFLQWFADRPGRVARAQQAGFEFVVRGELEVNNMGVASDLLQDGNTDLGNQISIHGGVGENGQSERLFLMKQKKEWYEADQKVRQDRNEQVAEAIRGGNDLGGNPHEERGDSSLRYLGQGTGGPRKKQPDNMFTRKRNR